MEIGAQGEFSKVTREGGFPLLYNHSPLKAISSGREVAVGVEGAAPDPVHPATEIA